MPKAGFISLGCPKNLVDSEVMMGILARNGYEFTPRAEEAEVLVVNTCSFIAPGAERIDRHDSGNGRIQEIRRGEKIDCGRLPGGALPRPNPANKFPKSMPWSAPAKWKAFWRPSKANCAQTRRAAAALPSYLYHDLTPRILSTPQARRVHQDRRRLRPSLHVLHHSAIARKVSQPAI